MENKLKSELFDSFHSLREYCEAEKFKGWDPYDGLNSKIFKSTPIKKWDLARLAWIQLFKRSPFNLRPLFLVPKQYNAKGLGLFLNGYCNLYHASQKGIIDLSQEKLLEKIHFLSNELLSIQNTSYSGSCWGYNFDWQARRLFLFPSETPTVVATTFCVHALSQAYDITKDERVLQAIKSSADFIKNDLNRTQLHDGFLFSYSPLNGNNTVYNASLLGAKCLSIVYKYTGDQENLDLAKQTISACCKDQQKDGSWVYGMLPVQSWIDSFHTGYNLDAIQFYQDISGDKSFQKNIELGFEYYIQNFFEEDGCPKYYNDKKYPIDIHCPGQLFVNLHTHNAYCSNANLAKKVFHWTVENMQDSKGYFYYQIKKRFSSKISYMRWSNAFMFNALSFLVLNQDT